VSATLPPFLQDVIARPPRAGEGVHPWLFRVSRQLHAHLPAGEIVRLLENRVANCGRHVPRNEIVQAVQNSLPCAWQPERNSMQSVTAFRWPALVRERVRAITSAGQGLPDVWEASPVRIEDSDAHTEEIIDRLFPQNPLLCCGKSSRDFDTKPREAWRGQLVRLAHIVPSPMTAVAGMTKEGKQSPHSLANTGPRRFVIVEFDTGTIDAQAALLLHLATFAPMVLVVHSGGKSLHGWFFAAGRGEDVVRKFFAYAVSLGADPATWTRSQFVRMPDGTRDNGARQTVYFLNTRPL